MRLSEEDKKYFRRLDNIKLFKGFTDQLSYKSDKYVAYFFFNKENTRQYKYLERILEKKFPDFAINDEEKFHARGISVKNSYNIYFKNTSIKGEYIFNLKGNSSIILENVKHIIITKKGEKFYDIGLAFIISFGDKVNITNYYSVLDELISYYLNKNKDGA